MPRAIFRLLYDSLERGEQLSDQSGIVLFWLPGRPPKEVRDGPATLAQILGLPIRLFYAEPGTERNMVIPFDP